MRAKTCILIALGLLTAEATGSLEESETESPTFTVYADAPDPVVHYDLINKNTTSYEIKCEAPVDADYVMWSKDDRSLTKSTDSWFYSIGEDGKSLMLKPLTVYALGTYTCTAYRSTKPFSGSLNLDLRNRPRDMDWRQFGWILTASLVSFAVVASVSYVCWNRERDKQEHTMRIITEKFFDGEPNILHPDISPIKQMESLPYLRSYEIRRSRISIGIQIGKGTFGPIFKAKVACHQSPEKFLEVALKRYSKKEKSEQIRVLEGELKALSHLGRHLNIVNLVGANTFSVEKDGGIWLLLEFCNFGDLLSFVQRRRHNFVVQQADLISDVNSCADSTVVVLEKDVPVDSLSLEPLSTGDHLSSSSTVGSTCTQGLENSAYTHSIIEVNAPKSNTGSTVSLPGSSLSPPSSEEASSSTFEDHQREGDGRDDRSPLLIPSVTEPFTVSDLVGWAWQVTRGMSFLAQRKVAHGGLALENIYLTRGNIVKVGNFGFRRPYQRPKFFKKKKKTIDYSRVRWLSVEAIREQSFSTPGDVWSFGVLLWELFSLGKTPYPDIEVIDETFFSKLEGGYRMGMPQFADHDIYSMMKECWLADPLKRPGFESLGEQFARLLPPQLTENYIRMNKVYEEYNARKFENQTDALIHMAAPEYKTPEEIKLIEEKILESKTYQKGCRDRHAAPYIQEFSYGGSKSEELEYSDTEEEQRFVDLLC